MKSKNLVVLALVAVVLVVFAVKSSKREVSVPPDLIGRNVFPDLPVNDVTAVSIRSAAGAVTLKRSAESWVAAEAFNHPVDFDKVRAALLKLADLKIGQVVEADEAQRKDLSLTPPVVPAAAAADTNAPALAPEPPKGGTLVELHGAKGVLASLLIGREHAQKPQADAGPYGGYSYPDGQYILPGDSSRVYLVAGTIGEFYTKPKEWLNTDLFNVDSADLQSVTITTPGQPPLKLHPGATPGSLDVEGRGENEEADAAKVSGIQSALSFFRFDDVADPALTDAQAGLYTPTVFEAETAKGEVYTVRLGKTSPGGGGRYARVAAALKELPAPAVTPPSTNAADIAAAEQKKLDEQKQRKELADKVESVNRKCGAWTYLIPAYKAESLAATRELVLKPKAPPAATNAPPAEAGAPVAPPAASASPADTTPQG